MSKYCKRTELLHSAFDMMSIGTEFTSDSLFQLSYGGTQYTTKKERKKVSNFITNQQAVDPPSIERTGSYSDGTTRMGYVVFKKITHLIKYEDFPSKNLPSEFYHFLGVWNLNPDSCCVTPSQFKRQAGNATKLIYEFLNLLAKHEFAIKSDKQPVSYEKIGNVTLEMMETNFVIIRKRRSKNQLPETEGVTMAKKATPIKSLAEVTASELGIAVVQQLLDMRKQIDMLTQNKKDLTKLANDHATTVHLLKEEKVKRERVLTSRNAEIEELKTQISNVELIEEKKFKLTDIVDMTKVYKKGDQTHAR